jgi:cob(I)alamin adenosyltransferase
MSISASFTIETKIAVSSKAAAKRDPHAVAHGSVDKHLAALQTTEKLTTALTREEKLKAIDSVLSAQHAELTDQQIVIVKDTWNKMLPWSDICMEYFAERFFFLFPGECVYTT